MEPGSRSPAPAPTPESRPSNLHDADRHILSTGLGLSLTGRVPLSLDAYAQGHILGPHSTLAGGAASWARCWGTSYEGEPSTPAVGALAVLAGLLVLWARPVAANPADAFGLGAGASHGLGVLSSR